jgi:hypothetical protein
VSPSSSRFRGNVFTQKGREAAGDGSLKKPGSGCHAMTDLHLRILRMIAEHRHLRPGGAH